MGSLVIILMKAMKCDRPAANHKTASYLPVNKRSNLLSGIFLQVANIVKSQYSISVLDAKENLALDRGL